MRRAALHAEWTKLRTSPGTGWLLFAVVTLTVVVSAAATATCSSGGCDGDPTKISLTGVQLGQAVVAILAVLTIGNEYGTGLIGTTLTAIPRRITMLGAKAAVLTGIVVVTAILAVAGSLLAGRLLQPSRLPAPTDRLVLRAAVGSVCYLALIALLSLGIATAVRDSATAIGIVLGLLYVYPIIVDVVSDPHLRHHLQQLGPMSAGLAVQATTQLGRLPIGPWKGLGVLAGWASAALLAGGLSLRGRGVGR